MPPAEQDQNDAVDAFVGAVQKLASDDNYKIIADVFRDAQNLKTENTRLRCSSRDLLEQYRKFRNELEAKEIKLVDENTRLRQSIEQKDARIQELEAASVKLDAKLQKSLRMLDEESQKCLELVKKNDDLGKTTSELQGSLHEKSKLLSEFEAFKSNADDLTEAKRNLEVQSEELSSLKAAKIQVESQLEDMRAQLEEKTKQLTILENAQSAVDSQLAEFNVKLEERIKETEDLTASNHALAAELAEAKDKLSEKSQKCDDLLVLQSSLETNLSEMTIKMESTQQELKDLSEAKAGLETAVNSANEAVKSKAMEADELTSQLAEANQQNEKEAAKVQDLESQLAEANVRAEAKTQELSTMLAAKAAVDTQLAEINAQLLDEREGKRSAEEDLKAAKEDLQKETERTSILMDEVTHLRQTISDRNQDIERLEKDAVESRDSLSEAQLRLKELQSTTKGLEQELKAKSDRLDKIDKYHVKLKHEPEVTCVEVLDTIWVSILDLAEKHFGQDLEEPILRDPSCWAGLRSSEHLRHLAVRLPLPQSNSPAAKQMRIAAVLAVLSRVLARHVFRPVYAVDNDAELAQLLRGLEAASQEQELHVRGALLGALPPERAAASAARRAKAVVREVSFLVQHLLSALQYEAFCNALEACVALACAQWGRIQGAAMKIEPYFGPPYDDFDWQVLLLPERFADGRLSSGSTLGLDAGSETIGGSSRSLAQVSQDAVAAPLRDDDASTIAESIRSVVDPADIMMVLWPTMCAVEGGELVSITQGLVMAKEQAAAAFEEEGRRRPLLCSKRARSMSQSRNGVTRNSHSGKSVSTQAKRDRDSSASNGPTRNGSRQSRHGPKAAGD